MALALRAAPNALPTPDAPPAPPARAPQRPPQPPRHTWPEPALPLTALDWRLYHWLVHLARTGQEVPRAPALAAWLGFGRATGVDKAYRALAAAGLIALDLHPLDGRRLRFLQRSTVGLADLPDSLLTLTEEA